MNDIATNNNVEQNTLLIYYDIVEQTVISILINHIIFLALGPTFSVTFVPLVSSMCCYICRQTKTVYNEVSQ